MARSGQALVDPTPVDDAPIRFLDLGPLRVDVAGAEHTAGGAKPARILSTLLVNANRRVSVDALLLAVWGESPADSATNTLESHVWRLRRLLEPRRGPRQPPTYLVNDSGGYRLVVNPDNADSLRFAQLAEQGDDLLVTGAADRALRQYERALHLWRGRPFEAVADEQWAAAAVARLDEVHAQVNEQQVEALLALGERDRAIALLEELTVTNPFRERLWSQLMLALYQVGRVEEALNTYRRARTALLDEIGLEPGAELRELHQRMLAQDPALAPTAPPTVAASPRPPRTAEIHLPVRLSGLIGRDAEFERLTRLVGRTRLVTLVGAAGCGKTRLAIEVARAAAPGAPDGVWFLDLTAVEDPETLVDTVVSALGLAAPAVGGALTTLRSYVRDRQLLLLFDNCEHVLPAVRQVLDELLAEDGQLHILATSREPVGIDGEVLWTLAPLSTSDDATDHGLSLSPAAQLFVSKAEGVDPSFELTHAARADVESICSAVDGLPLAIELAAGRIRSASLAEICRQVVADPARLARLGYERVEHHRTVDLSIEWSARLLSEPERAAHARLSVLPGVFTVEAATAAAGFDPVRPDDVPELLAQLTHRSLLAAVPAARSGEPSRFRQLATVRAHAARALSAAGLTGQVGERRRAWLRELLAARPTVARADTHGWYACLEHNHDTLAAALQHSLVDEPDPFGVHLTAQVRMYWLYWKRMIEGARWTELALGQHAADPADRALTQLGAAYAYAARDRADLAEPLIRQALAHADAVDPHELAHALVSVAWGAWVRQDSSLGFVDDEVRARAAGGDPTIGLYADVLAAKSALASDGPRAAGAFAAELLQRSLRQGNLAAAWLCGWLGVVCAVLTADPETGMELLPRVGEYHHRLGGTLTANLLEFQGDFAVLAADLPRGVELFARARTLAFRAGTLWPIAAATGALLARARRELPRELYEQSWRVGEATGD